MIDDDGALRRTRRTGEPMKLLTPWKSLKTLPEIDLALLRKEGLDTLLLDMDNTIVPWHTFDVDEPTDAWFKQAQQMGFTICILSNNRRWRIDKLAGMLGVLGGWSARKPFLSGYLRALRTSKSSVKRSVFIGDQLFTDILGANVLGMRTILVHPLSQREHRWTRWMRVLERKLTGRTFHHRVEEP